MSKTLMNAVAGMALALVLALPFFAVAQRAEDALRREVLQGNVAGVRHWLSQGADPNDRSLFLLIYAAERGYADIVGLLVDAGARLEERSYRESETALMVAARLGHEQVVRVLLAKGADPNARKELPWEFRLHGSSAHTRPDNHMSAIMLSAQAGHTGIVELLAKAGARVNARSKYDETALMFAAGKGHAATVRKLLDLGAELDANAKAMKRYSQDRGGTGGGTALTYALRDKRIEAAGVLIGEYERRRESVDDGDTAFAYAIMARDAATVKRLAALKGVDAASPAHLSLAARTSTPEILGFLRARQSSSRAGRRDEVLTAAAGSGDLAKVKLLLDAGADLNARDYSGQNALYYAVYKSADDVAAYLIDQGIEVNVTGSTSLGFGNMGDTALAMAVQNGRLEILRRLLAAGADVRLKRPGGKSAVEVAHELGRTDVLLAFVAAGRLAPQDLPPYARGKSLYRLPEPIDPPLLRRSGELLYASHCAAHCHGLDGNGVGGHGALRQAKLSARGKASILRRFLQGPPTSGVQQHDYAARLLDAEALAVLAYIETAWGNRLGWAAQASDIQDVRPGAPGKVQESLVGQGAQPPIEALGQRGYLYTETFFVAAVKADDREAVELFLSAGMSPSARDADGYSAPYVATSLDNAALLARLLDAGAELDARNRFAAGYGTPAYAAVNGFKCRDRGQALGVLLERGLDPNARHGGSPLLLSAVNADCETAVRLLLERGADPNVDWGGWTPLKAAKAHKREPLVQMLIAAGARQ